LGSAGILPAVSGFKPETSCLLISNDFHNTSLAVERSEIENAKA
jgi:hypothetical protein